jgi:hypothetical protein
MTIYNGEDIFEEAGGRICFGGTGSGIGSSSSRSIV